MAQTIVDLSQPGSRVVPTLAHDLILGNPSKSAGARAGVATLGAVKDLAICPKSFDDLHCRYYKQG